MYLINEGIHAHFIYNFTIICLNLEVALNFLCFKNCWYFGGILKSNWGIFWEFLHNWIINCHLNRFTFILNNFITWSKIFFREPALKIQTFLGLKPLHQCAIQLFMNSFLCIFLCLRNWTIFQFIRFH